MKKPSEAASLGAASGGFCAKNGTIHRLCGFFLAFSKFWIYDVSNICLREYPNGEN